MSRAFAVLLVAACSSPSPHAQLKPTPVERAAPPPEAPPAIPDDPQPTLRLPHTFTPTGYRAHLTIDPEKPTFAAEIAIAGALDRTASVIWLHGMHLTVGVAAARDAHGSTVALTVTPRAEDLLEVRAAQPLAAGAWTLDLAYTGTIAHDQTKGAYHVPYGSDHYVLTDFEPTAARLVFPSVDEPGSKVPWELTIDAPTTDVVVSNAAETAATKLDATHTRHAFGVTRPLPTYLVAFAVGPFDILDAGASKSGVPVRAIVPHGAAPRAEYLRVTTPKLLDALEGWFGMKYPYPKLDVVVAPAYAYNAMEHAGAIFTDPIYALVDKDTPSWAARHQVVMVIGHEMAHQWFGDLVTPAWWEDIWLNESFATWFENKIPLLFDPVAFPDEGLPAAVRWGAVHADALVSAQRIREPIVARAGIESAFDGITYNKGASLLRMIERYIGEETFQRGVRAYLKAHADGSATVTDLLGALEAAAGKPVTQVMAPFLDQGGIPAVTATVACGAGAAPKVTIAQQRYVSAGSPAPTGAAPKWQIPMCVVYPDARGKRAEACGVVDRDAPGNEIALALPAGACPAWIVPNGGGVGYFDTAFTEAQAKAIEKLAWPQLTANERRVAFEDVRRQTLDGAIPVTTLMTVPPKLLAAGDRFSVGDALGGIGRDGDLADMTGLPFGLRGAVQPALLPKVQAWVRGQIGAKVKAMAFATASARSIDVETIAAAYTGAAIAARDPSLVKPAIALAKHFRDLPAAIRADAMRVAADADPAVWKELFAAIPKENDHDLRIEEIGAVAGVHDPVRHTRALDLALDPAFPTDDFFALFFATPDEQTRAAVEQWLRANWPALSKRLPPASEGNIGKYLGGVAAEACDPARRDEIAAYITSTFGPIFGAERLVKQQIERMDQCIRQRALLAPSIDAWLKAAH